MSVDCSVDCARGVRSLSPRSPLLIQRTYFTLFCLTLTVTLSNSLSLYNSLAWPCTVILCLFFQRQWLHGISWDTQHTRASYNPLGLLGSAKIYYYVCRIIYVAFRFYSSSLWLSCFAYRLVQRNSEVSYFVSVGKLSIVDCAVVVLRRGNVAFWLQLYEDYTLVSLLVYQHYCCTEFPVLGALCSLWIPFLIHALLLASNREKDR